MSNNINEQLPISLRPCWKYLFAFELDIWLHVSVHPFVMGPMAGLLYQQHCVSSPQCGRPVGHKVTRLLGMMIPSKEMKIYLPKVKVEKIKKKMQVCLCTTTSQSDRCHASMFWSKWTIKLWWHSYLNKMGGTHEKDLSDLPLQIWQWSLERNMVITAQY